MESFNVSKDSWVNRYATSSGAFDTHPLPIVASSSGSQRSTPIPVGSTGSKASVNWRLTRATLKNGTLSFHKPPTDLAIKSFDPFMVAVSTTANVADGSLRQYQQPPSPYNDQPSVMDDAANDQSSSKAPTSLSSSRRQLPAASGVNLSLNPTLNSDHIGSSPHPDLEYDENGEIVGASLDALCHTILFSNDGKYAQDAFLALPLMVDIVTGLQVLKSYVQKNASHEDLRAFMVQRAGMIVQSAVQYFSGMFLETNIVNALVSFLNSLSKSPSDLAELKQLIADTHQKMSNLLYYNGDENDFSNWNAQQDNVDFGSDKLTQFFAKIDKLATNDRSRPAGSSEKPTNVFALVTPDIFIEMCSSDFLAQQISWFHLRFYENWCPSSDISLLFKTSIYRYHRLNPLVFDFGDCHFLGRLMVDLVLKQPSTAASRARILSAWINLGNAFKSYGDIVGWISIASVLCSVPIFRLRNTWAHVSKELRDCVIKDWGFEIFEVEKRSKIDVLGKKTFRVSTEEMGESYPKERAVPYFGDLFVKNDLSSNNNRGIYGLSFDRLNRVRMVLNGWKYYFDQVPQNDTFSPGPEPIAAVQKLLYFLLRENAQHATVTLEEMMQLSLNVEPAASTEYLKYHYTQRSPLTTGGFLPLLFTEVSPGYKLFAKPALIAASGILSQGTKRSLRGSKNGDSPSTLISSPLMISGPTMASSASSYNLSGVDSNTSSGSFASFSKYSFRKNVFGGGSHNPDSPIPNSTDNASTSSLTGALPTSASVGHSGSTGSIDTGAVGLYRSNSFPPAISGGQFSSTTGVKDVDFASRRFISQLQTHNIFMKTIKDVLNVGARIFPINDDIVLKCFDDEIKSSNNGREGSGSESTSRPSSVIEAPSKRLSDTSSRRMSAQLVSTGSRLSTDFSLIASAFENSSVSKRHTSAQSPLSVNVVVKAANLERLVDILVLGVNEFSSFIAKEDIESLQSASTRSIHGLLKRPHFHIDMNIHTLTFFATFRSFCSPLDLVSSLRKRFVGAANAAISIVEWDRKQQIIERAEQEDSDMSHGQDEHLQYPNWEPNGFIDPDNTIAWRIVAQIQIGVLEACHLWVSHYFSDFMNDCQLKDQFLELIRIFGSELNYWKEIISTGKDEHGKPAAINEDYRSYLESMEALYKKVRNLFVKKSYRPNDVPPLIGNFPAAARVDNLMVGNNEVTMMRIEKFVDELDTVVNDIYSMMNLHNWMEVFEVLELQSVEPTGFFKHSTPPSVSDDDLIIEDIYGFIESLNAMDKQDTNVLSLLPQPVQELFRIHKNIVSYFVSQISDPSIQKEDRVARIMTLVKTLAVCRARMTYLDIFDSNNLADASLGGLSTRVPSFMESAIIASIIRPESRLFANSWIQAGRELQNAYEPAISRVTQQASISLSSPNVYELYVPEFEAGNMKYEHSHRAATPCVGWVIERMLEIACYVPNMSVERSTLINFDKRRYIYNLITNIQDFGNPGSDGVHSASRDGLYTDEGQSQVKDKDIFYRKLAHIINPDPRLYVIDKRVVSDVAAKEARQYPKNALKNRVFLTYVGQEQEKIKRDNRQKEILEKHGREPKKPLYKFKGTSSAGSTYNGIAGHQTHSGGLLGAARDRSSIIIPSMNNNSSGASISDRKPARGSRFGGLLKAVRPISMAFGTTNAPGFASANDRTVPVSELPDISTLTDVRYKAMMTIDLAKVINIDIVDSELAVRLVLPDASEYTLQGLNSEDSHEWAHYLLMAQRYSKYKAFVSPDCTKVFGVPLEIVCERENAVIPRAVETLLSEIEKRGLEEVGLYRVSGSVASVNLLKTAFDSGKTVNMDDPRWYDINTIAGCFKLYLRELPEPLLTNSLYQEFIKCGKNQVTDVHDLGPLYHTMRKLPPSNFTLLKRLLEHLGAVVDHEEENKMKTPNLAIVFSMSFLPSNGIEFMRATQNLVNTMIVYHKILLGSTPPDAVSVEDADRYSLMDSYEDGEVKYASHESEDTASTASTNGQNYTTASNKGDVYSNMKSTFSESLAQRPVTFIERNEEESYSSDIGSPEETVAQESPEVGSNSNGGEANDADADADATEVVSTEEAREEVEPVTMAAEAAKRSSTHSQGTQSRDSFTEVSAY